MFSLDKQSTTITQVTPRSEKHGEDHVTATDVFCAVTLTNKKLDDFAPNLRAALYTNATTSGHNMALDMEEDYLPNLRFVALKKLPYDLEVKDCVASLELPGQKKPIVFSEAKFSKLVFHPQEGGSVKITFKLADYPGGPEIGKLCQHIGSEVDLSLTMPVPDAEPEFEEEDELE